MRWALMLMLLAAPVGAQVFKWTDDKGKVHYGDAPPAMGAGTAVNTNRNSVPAGDVAAQRKRMDEAEVERLARSRVAPECQYLPRKGDADTKRKADEESLKCMRHVVRRDYGMGATGAYEPDWSYIKAPGSEEKKSAPQAAKPMAPAQRTVTLDAPQQRAMR